MGRWDRRAVGCIFVELVAQRPDRDAENVGGMRAVAEAMPQRLKDQVSLDFGHRTADEVAGDLLGRHGCLRRNVRTACLVEARAIRRKNTVHSYFRAA